MQAFTFNNILTSALQAEWIVGVIQRRVTLPTQAAMCADVDLQRRWKRAVVPPTKFRSAVYHPYMHSYHEQLLRDLPDVRPARAASSVREFVGNQVPVRCRRP